MSPRRHSLARDVARPQQVFHLALKRALKVQAEKFGTEGHERRAIKDRSCAAHRALAKAPSANWQE